MKKTLSLSVLFLLAFLMPACAQGGMIVEHYTLEEGLPSNTVYCSIKDSDGFVWFGTWYGLCSFDGYKFTPFVTRTRQDSDIPPRKVISLVEDKDGYLWIRNVDNRLYLYDKRVNVYHEVYDELKKMSQNVQVIKIQKAYNGHVLLLTRNKNLYEASVNGKGEMTVSPVFDGSFAIDQVSLRLQHNILGVTDRHLYWLGTDFQLYVLPRPKGNQYLGLLKPGKHYDYFMQRGNRLYLGTHDGEAYVIDCKTGSVSNNPQGQIVEFIDRQGLQWNYERDSHTLVSTNPATGLTQRFPMPQGERIAQRKYCDAGDNGLFFLMASGEVWRYDRQTGLMQNIAGDRQFATPSPSTLRFYDMDIDSEGLLWLSSTMNGVYKVNFPPSCFRFFMPATLSQEHERGDSQGIRALFQQRNGDLWIGMRNGTLLRTDPQTGQPKPSAIGNIGNVYHMMEDHAGNLWFCTKGNGLFKATAAAIAEGGGAEKLIHYKHVTTDRYSLNDDRVYYVFEDTRHRIWACTFGGGLNLIEQRNGQTVFINRNNEFKHYPRYDLYLNVRAVTEDAGGRLWIGTTDGLMSIDGRFKRPQDIQFEIYREQQDAGTVDNDIFSLYKDSRGNIWIGMFGGGLNRLEGYDTKQHRPLLENYPFTEQMNGNVVSSIIEDQRHRLWICTENGLASLSPETGSPNDYRPGTIRSYDRFSGFPIVNVEDNTIACLHDGRILIGCQQGVLAFSPDEVAGNHHHPSPIFIVDFRVQNRPLTDFDPPIYEGSVRYAREITLSHNQSMFSIEFASLNYLDQNQVAYTYILEGYEDRWHTDGNNRIASYANVPPGRYTFHVKTIGNNAAEQTLAIRVLPPWWATWWAYLVYALLFLALLYGAFRLVTYMIRMRNETYVNDRLAELKIRFFTNVSHELRTPLTLIKSPIEELKKSERLSASGKEYLQLIDNNAKKMLQLVNQILDFRKVQNGKMKMHVSLVDLNDMLELFRQEYRVLAQERDISYEFLLPDEHVRAWCDAQKISVVVNNLISNAFKYTHEGGSVSVSMEQADDNRKVIIRVEDDGANIPEDKLEEIFERFAQADNRNDDTSATGTGIGLSLSREFVLMHHGHIWAENLARGAAFIVELPTGKENYEHEEVEEKTTVPPETTAPADTLAPASLILLIEDNIDLCRMLSLQLKDKYTVQTAHDGEEGLKKVYQYHPDIIVSDLMMPKMDGMELLKRIRQDFNISHIPVIILTAKQGEDVHIQTISTGANAYITKPFSSELLQARISQLLEEQRIFQRKMVLQNAGEDGITTGKGSAEDFGQHLIQKDLEFVSEVRQVIDSNLQNEDFNINALAGQMGLSRSVFFKKMKSLTGFAPVDFVKEVRLAKALQMMETSSLNVTEIAYAAGFHDPGYFSKCFRQKYGKTPKEYRAAKSGPTE